MATADDDDDGFGDFTFVSSSPNPNHHHHHPNQDDDDDDWGDFVQSPQTNSIQPPSSFSSSSSSKRWEKPKGAIPLSIFGEDLEEEEEEAEAKSTEFVFNSSKTNTNGFSSSFASRDVRDLISHLYAQPPLVVSSDPPKEKNSFSGDYDDDDNDWEFRGSLPKKEGSDGIQKTNDQLVFSNGGRELSNGNELHPISENGDRSSDDEIWDFKDASSEISVVSGSLGNEKTTDAEAQVFVPGNKDQGSGNLLDNNLGDQGSGSLLDSNLGDFTDFNASTCAKEKEEFSEFSWTVGGSLIVPNSVGTVGSNLQSVTAFNDIISNLYNETGQSHVVYPTQYPNAHGPEFAELSAHSAFTNNGNYPDNEIEWEFQEAIDPTLANLSSACKVDKNLPCSTQHTCLDLYNKLKEGSLFLIVHHLGDLKKSHEVATPDEEATTLKMNEDIQAVYMVLQEANISENDYMAKYPSKGACVNELVEFIKEPFFRPLEEEYRLSERILSAENELRASVELFRHASSRLHILGLATVKEQQAYIAAWSKMALACSKELNHGAMIWKESLSANVSEEILARGRRYFAALVEIYGVTEILRTSLKLYMPWILSTSEENYSSNELVSWLEKCAEAWTLSGMGKTLESIFGATTDKAIKLFSDLDFSFHNPAFDNAICKLSLLPVDKLQDVKVVTWNGHRYCLKLANLWANRVSCNPPLLPQIGAS